MPEVGVKELKNSLSRYLRRARAGEVIDVTDRGTPIARIIPIGLAPDVATLMAEGRVTWSGARFIVPEEAIRLKPGRPLSDYISEDRG